MARAAIAAGADGLMIEVHHDPDNALSDGAQSLYPKQFGQLVRDIYVISPVVGKQLDFDYLSKAATVAKLKKSRGKGEQRAAFLGEVGSFSHKAYTQYFGTTAIAEPVSSFKDIFEAVKTGSADFGIFPLENSLTGSIHENYDLLLDYDVKIIGEITIRVIHHLIGNPGTDIETIKRVYSIPQVFQQCRQFLDRHNEWELVSARDTASAVKRVIESANNADAAIGSQEAAEMYQMAIIEEGVETNPRNFTRFVVIGAKPPDGKTRQKSSIIFSAGHRPGALFELLKIFKDNNINLVKLESRPIHGKPWEYMFYVDFEADAESESFKPIQQAIEDQTDYLKILGSY
jgi:prephenate dehydratase